jgi:UDP-N-acetylglucosamine 2-epimerase
LKIFSIVGARPQFIKLAPLSAALQHMHEEVIVHTGQHYDYAMSEAIFNDLGIRKPDIHLEIGQGAPLVQITQIMLRLEEAILKEKPELVIIFGDTNSTLAGAMVAAKMNIPLLHIEAGLRSYNRSMPEEINRVASDHMSQYLFAPTVTAVQNLEHEGLGKNTFFTGDIMVDTMETSLSIALKKSTVIDDLQLQDNGYNLLTLHRNYNVDNPEVLASLLQQVGQLEETIVFPIHPRTKKMLGNSYSLPKNIQMVEPQGYLNFIRLEHSANKIITDSGGIQKEAYLLKKPCITLRTETEWVETVNEGWNLLVNPQADDIAAQIRDFNTPENQMDVFGKNVTKKMTDIINRLN